MINLVEELDNVGAISRELPDGVTCDDMLYQNQPRKSHEVFSQEFRDKLEAEHLLPSTSFSTYWLNKLQERWPQPTSYEGLFKLAPTQTRTIVRFTREGLEGRVTGYKEVTVPAESATAKNSTSLLRKPANRADFVRGASGFFPFAPGGLEGVEVVANLESSQHMEMSDSMALDQSGKASGLERVINFGVEGALLEVAPGLARGLKESAFSVGDAKAAREVEEIVGEEPEPEGDEDLDKIVTNQSVQNGLEAGAAQDIGDEDIDALLPVEYPSLAPRGELLPMQQRRLMGKEWAHMVDLNKEFPNFYEMVPEMARTWPFELDTFQKEAVYHLEQGDSVFVAAHTSAGKTVVAEYAIALAAKHMTKAIYTSPIKALSNQKFRDFRNEFDDVGILTGDVQIRPEANCLIMTTEILRSMLYRGADLIRDVEFVIFDEVHYVNNEERGVVWEEVIIMLPEHVTLILLSATVPNTYEFASWVGRTKRKDIYVISTLKRPVPLEHYLWANKDMYKIVNADKKFLEQGWKAADDEIKGKDKIPAAQSTSSPHGNRGGDRGRGGRGNQRGGGGQQRGGSQQRGGPRGGGNIARTGRGTGRSTAAQDRQVWTNLVQYLRKKDLLPACVFVFSKKRCQANADSLSNLDFTTAAEKSAIHMTIERSIARLKPEDRVLPQILHLRELLSRGFAVHHGGMLPILKEVVEILFAKALVKVLFATETFAMGLNLPTRTVCFSGFRKYNNNEFRDLRSDEYTQMAGRAGRRGLDTVGTVIIVSPNSDEAPAQPRLLTMMLGEPTKLRSQFRLTYNMILNLLRVEALKIEEMIKRSFSEDAAQALLPEHEKQVKLTEADLEKIKREPCETCDPDLEKCHEAAMKYNAITAELYVKLSQNPFAKRQFAAKRLVVFKDEGVRRIGMILREGISHAKTDPRISVYFFNGKAKRNPGDLLPFIVQFNNDFAPLPKTYDEMLCRATNIPVSAIECITNETLNLEQDVEILIKKSAVRRGFCLDQVLPLVKDWNSKVWEETDWSKIKDLKIREMIDERKKLADLVRYSHCLTCTSFVKHFAMQHDEWLLKENIAQLKQLMSDQNLRLLPDYEQRVEVLKELGFLDESSRVELKGKVACEIHSADELILTELILENVLADYEPEEIVALLSAFVFQDKTESEPTLTGRLEQGRAKILEIAERVTDVQVKWQVLQQGEDANPFADLSKFGLVEVVYEWARGVSFKRIMELTDVMEGSIVRTITRLDETCREVKNAARIVGDPGLYQKMNTCQELIKRDVCAVASLYM